MNKLLSIFLISILIVVVSYTLKKFNLCELYNMNDSAITNPASW